VTLDELKAKRGLILSVASRHGAGNVRVFGLVARGEDNSDSDVDLLVDVVGPTTPWFPGGLIVDLETVLERKVDVVTEDAVLLDELAEEACSSPCLRGEVGRGVMTRAYGG
jgi:uncharacterized protein